MKLMAVTYAFAGKPVIKVEWAKEALFFAGRQPAVPALITLELPGLKSHGDKAVREWLIAYHEKQGRSGEHTDLVEPLWRPSVLDDIVDSKNGSDFVWHLSNHFTLAEFADFATKHGPTLVDDIRGALAVARKQRASALRKLATSTEKIGGAIYSGTRRVPIEINELEMADDREAIAALGEFDAPKWIDACAQLKNDLVKRELLGTIGTELVRTKADIGAALDRMFRRNLHKLYAPELWSALTYHLELPPNVTGETIDLTKAREVTVPAGWDIWKARRIGQVKLGRAALFIYDGNQYTYVRGERKLLHAIRERGGTITRWGCTLTVGIGKDTVQAKLLEVDRIDTLAQVDPKAAARLAGESLPTTHPITSALARAQEDPTWRRILADLLIERLVGIDADVARQLARTQARANRRIRF